ncbi:MAG: TonB-dependent receptor SusC [Candidatus Ordinivivax streblomastigis]|uniref:TonB-dependent receptor SusC n=1 Tax=Candidatus Ordinivivax streblomastigis TaxID=2540710 RepID=A0A5M8NWM3_9BACT|nr:MAG: TonB-dependent receptor SusC [Candidatus Ordinivivax streblomastigis]
MKKILNKMKVVALVVLALSISTRLSAQLVEDKSSPVGYTNQVFVTLVPGTWGANYTIKGQVVDLATQKGFAGVRISVLNTKLTAMSDEEGRFEIKVPNTDVTFSVDAPGYQSQLVPLQGRAGVITIGMLRQTGAAAFYDGTEFSTTGVNSVSDFSNHILTIDEDLTARLGGQVRSIIHSGTPASGSAVFARGFNSLNATSQPLYVVDGIVWQSHESVSANRGFYNNPLAVIDPKDVEKITVLKGGSSIYGSKGANGVILIDTKRSRSQATAITVDLGWGYRLPFKSIPVMNGNEYLSYVSDIISGKSTDVNAVERYKFLENDPAKSYYKDNHNNTDWLSLINQSALTQNYGISVQGGDDIALYAISVGYAGSEGNVENTDFDRFNFRINSDISLTKAFKLAFDVAFTQTHNNLRNDGIDNISSPVYLSLIKSPLYNPYDHNANGSLSSRLKNYDELGIGNPLALIDNGIGETKNYAMNTSVLPTYTFSDKLKASLLFSYGWRKLNENTFTPDLGVAESPLYNELGEIYAESKNFVQDRMDTHTSIIVDGNVNWVALKDATNSLSFLGGYRFYSDSYKSHFATGHNTGSDNISQLSNTDINLRTSDGLNDNWRSMSWYANGDYAFKSKYLLSASVAADASSRFGGKAWGTFPSASAGWIISSEEFMQNVDFINFLKLTAGYSLSGNDDIPNYASRTYFSSIAYTVSTTGLILGNIGNPNLKWETTGMATAGLDFSMFNNRWNVKAEYYTSTTKDLLTQKQLKDVAGLKYYWSNDGELKNTGFEVSTNVRVVNGRDWKLDFGASIGHYKNEITSLANGSFITEVVGAQVLTQVGQPAGVFYGYKTDGVFSTTDAAATANLSIRNAAGQLIPFEAGDERFAQIVNDGVIDEKDRQIIGDPNPDFYGNFNFNLSWKSFTLSALFTYSQGNEVYDALRANLESGNSADNQSTAMRYRWVANGQTTNIPRATYGDPMGNARFSDRWIEDGSYLRFKSLALEYKLPVHLDFLQGISVWGSVNNIYTFTKYLGSDPEVAYGNSVFYQGIDAGLVPQTRAFNLGVKINL